MTELSNDAKVILKSYFLMGENTTLRVGGEGAQSRLTQRALAAMNELIVGGYVTAKPFNDVGRMEYQGTEKAKEVKVSLKFMLEFAKWSATEPNV